MRSRLLITDDWTVYDKPWAGLAYNPGFIIKLNPAGFTGFMRAGFWGFMGFM